MRILHVAASYLPATRYGGTIVSVHGLCKALAARGHDVHVFTTNVDGARDSDVPLLTPVDVDGVKVSYFPSRNLRRLYWSPPMGQALARQIGDFDIAHLHALFVWPVWAAARAARRAGVPYVVAPRGMLEKGLVRRKSRWLKTALIAAVVRRVLEQAAAVHVTSAREAAEAATFGFALPRICDVPNGVDFDQPGDRLTPPAASIAGLIDQGPYVLFLGRVSWKKGLDRLVASLPFAPGLTLVIAGNDEDGYLDTVMKQAAAAGVTARIRLTGHVHGADKHALLHRAQLLVLPSYSENFGNVVLEAMAAGCPVVVTPEVGVSDVVRDSGAGWVVDGVPAALGAALAKLSADPEARHAMAEHGRSASGAYTWAAVAERMELLYREIAS
ncbi:MAG: glycosyltransferase [Vicinamibacterales bacterium]